MKKLLSIIVATLALCAFAGCSTTGGLTPIALQVTDASAEIIVKDATHLTLEEKPQWRPDFEKAYADVSILAAQDKVDIVTLAAIVNQLPVNELKSKNAKLIISEVEILVQRFAPNSGQIISTERYSDAKSIATAIRDGLRIGLDMP